MGFLLDLKRSGDQAAELILLRASSMAALANNELSKAKSMAQEGAWAEI